MKDILTFKDMIEKLNIYESITFPLIFKIDDRFETNQEIHNKIQKILVPENGRVITKCLDCNHEHAFFVYKTNVSYLKENDNKYTTGTMDYAQVYDGLNFPHISLDSPLSDNFQIIEVYDMDYYINYLCRCSNDYTHIQIITLRVILKKGQLTLIKVGQDPMNTELVNSESKIYQKQLIKFDSEEDFKNAIRSKDRNLYAGAATYLRRVFENIVKFYLSTNAINSDGKDMKKKLTLIQEYLDKDFYDFSNGIWSLLSKGIHELKEDEVLDMFKTLYGAIMFQLEFEKKNDDSKAKKEEISKSVSQLIQKHK